MRITDFHRARLEWRTADGSHGVWRVAAIAFPANDPEACFCLAPLVMAGDVYGRGRLPKDPVYSFQIAMGPSVHMIWRDFGEEFHDTADEHGVEFEHIKVHAPRVTRAAAGLRTLGAGSQSLPLDCAIEAVARDGVRWVLEFPIHHINHRGSGSQLEFQVESGPLLVPAGLVDPNSAVVNGGFALAYAFFNRLDRVDLAVMRHAGTHAAMRRDYSGYVCLDGAKIAILA
jgi:hypothetical protein